MLTKRKTRFTWREWSYTSAEESLFSLTRSELFIYRAIEKGETE
jgi:hypothetical protein